MIKNTWHQIKSFLTRVYFLIRENELKSITMLSGGAFFGQIISILIQPVATRLYKPEDFGVIAIISSLVTMFSSSLNGQYNLSIVSASSDKEANAVTALSLYIGMITSFIVSVGIVIYNILNPGTFSVAGYWIYMAIPFIFIAGVDNVLSSYNNRYEKYKLLASISVYRAVSSSIVKISLGIFSLGFVGLVIAYLFSILAGIEKQSEYLRKNLKEIFSAKKSEILCVLKRYKAQPLFSAPGIFVVTYASNIVPVFISILYGIKEVGYYSLAILILGLPVSIITGNVGTVFFRKASIEKAKDGNFYRTFKSSLVLLILISIIPFLFLFVFAKPICFIIFGKVWLRSGYFLQLLVPWFWAKFIVGALVISLIISGKQLLKLIIQLIFLGEVFIIYYVAKSLSFPIEDFILFLSLANTVTYLVLLFFIYKTSKLEEKNHVDYKTNFIYEE